MKGGAMCMSIVIAELKVVRRPTLSSARPREVQHRRARPRPRRRTLAAAGQGKSHEPHNSFDRDRPDEPMKLSNRFTRFGSLLTTALLASTGAILSADLPAAEPKVAPQTPAIAQRLFASPDEAQKPCRRPPKPKIEDRKSVV